MLLIRVDPKCLHSAYMAVYQRSKAKEPGG